MSAALVAAALFVGKAAVAIGAFVIDYAMIIGLGLTVAGYALDNPYLMTLGSILTGFAGGAAFGTGFGAAGAAVAAATSPLSPLDPGVKQAIGWAWTAVMVGYSIHQNVQAAKLTADDNVKTITEGTSDAQNASVGGAKEAVPGAETAGEKFVNPTGGEIRGCDVHGCGGFTAPREGGRIHNAVDYISKPGQTVVSPASGTVVREVTQVYRNAPHFSGLVIKAESGEVFRLFYVQADKSLIGTAITKGAAIGTAQDITVRYAGITNHVHLDIRSAGGKILDPSKLVGK